jgi:hypothetical protein
MSDSVSGTKISVSQALRVYQIVMDQGSRQGDARHFGGLIATADFDGYTVTLSDGTVTLRLLFHSKFSLDSPNGRALEQFIRKLQRIDRHEAAEPAQLARAG